MGYSSNVYKRAADKLFERRLKAEKSADARREEIYSKLPRVKELEQAIGAVGPSLARTVLAGGDVEENLKKLREQNLALQTELNNILLSNGYTADSLEPQYNCKKCNDTGYIEEKGRTVVCSCLKQTLISCACDELNRTAPLSLSTFDTFSLAYYDRTFDSKIGTSPYNQMSNILNFCKKYANDFTPNSASILMRGSTGLGKTHLSLAIANEVIKKGYGVIYVSAPSLTQYFEKLFHSKDSEDFGMLDMLTDCDLLIVDDLGTEMANKYYATQIYNLFNSRILLNKPTIINTNLMLRDMERNYSDRFVSRVVGSAEKLDFLGADIRIRKK